MAEHLPVLSVIVLFLGAFLTAILGNRSKTIRILIVTASILASFFLIIPLIKPVLIDGNLIISWIGDRTPEMGFSTGIGFEIDGLNLMFALIGVLCILVSGIYSYGYIGSEEGQEKYYSLFLLLSGSMLGMLFTGDLFNMIIMMALMTFAAAGITAYKTKYDENLNPALKLLIIDSLALVLIFLGTIMLYKQFHTLNMAQIAAMLHNNYTPVTLFAFAALLGGFGARAYLLPSHAAYTDVCRTAPAPVSMLLSGIVGMTGVYGIIRLLFTIYTSMNSPQMKLILIVWGTITMFFGALMSLGEKKLKGFLAYQGISQAGYVFLCVGFSTVEGLTGGLYHALNQIFFMGLLFLCTGAFQHAGGTAEINKLGGISKKMPKTALVFLIGTMAICGIPPFNGFISKFYIYELTLKSEYTAAAVVVLITSLITLCSFIKVVQGIFYGKLSEENQNITEAPSVMRIPMWAMATICIIFGALPEIVVKYLISPAVSAILNTGRYIDTMMGAGYAEKWFGEPLKNTSASSIFPEYLRIISLIFLLVLMIFVLSAIVGAFEIKIFERAYIDTKESIACTLSDRERKHFKVERMLKGIKYCFISFIGFIQKNCSYSINDYVLYVISVTAILLAYFFVFL